MKKMATVRVTLFCISKVNGFNQVGIQLATNVKVITLRLVNVQVSFSFDFKTTLFLFFPNATFLIEISVAYN